MTSRARLLVLLLSTPVVAFAVIGGFLGNAAAREDARQYLNMFQDVLQLVRNNYVEEVEFERVLQGALRGLAEGLDADSAYLLPDAVRRIESGAELPAGATGLELTRQYYLRVIAARDGSPAARAGLRTDDYVRAIDGRSTRDMSVFHGMQLLRGPAGSTVTLTVIRGSAAEPHTVELTREALPAPRVTGRVMEDGVGYIRVPAFGADTPHQIAARVAELTRRGATRLAVDVRSAAEGPLDVGFEAARLFVRGGRLGFREARDAEREPIAAGDADGSIRLPMVVLVSGGTAGAAELFAAALSGNDRAELIGERTTGRAGLQKLVKLPDGSGLYMTWARYLAPDEAPIHGKGLEPEVTVDEPEVEFGTAPQRDPILERALERLREQQAA